MKNYDEYKGYSYRLDFDPVSKTFVPQKIEPAIAPQLPQQPAPADPPTTAEIEDIAVAKLRKKATSLQSAGSPKAMRSRTCISLRKILPR